MLDEECLLPHGTDNGFVSLLETHTQVTGHGSNRLVQLVCHGLGAVMLWGCESVVIGAR